MDNLLQKSALELCNPIFRKDLTYYEKLKLLQQSKKPLICGAGNRGNSFLSFGGGWDYEEDFTEYATQGEADAEWISNDTANSRVDITNDWVWLQSITSVDKNIYHVLPFTFSDVAFVMQSKFRPLTLNGAGNNGLNPLLFGTDTIAPTRTGDLDALGSFMRYDVDAKSQGDFYKDGTGITTDTTLITLVVDTDYWIRDIRLSATSLKDTLYSDEYVSEIHSKTSTIPSTVIDLDNIALMNYNIGSDGQNKFSITDIKIGNGVTTPP